MREPQRLELKAGQALVVTWDDGRVDTLSAVRLRDACACAGCRNAPPQPADAATCRISTIGLVGAYAVNMVFAPDGHSTGIYPFPVLRDLGEASEPVQ
jgi:DUF971 family protein